MSSANDGSKPPTSSPQSSQRRSIWPWGGNRGQTFTRQPISTDPKIASYQAQTSQIAHMKWVLICTVVAGVFLMAVSVLGPYLYISSLHGNDPKLTLQILNSTTGQALVNAPRDVLPFATALVGFAGGVVTAMFSASTQQPKDLTGMGTGTNTLTGGGSGK
jgi:hypothetical protein